MCLVLNTPASCRHQWVKGTISMQHAVGIHKESPVKPQKYPSTTNHVLGYISCTLELTHTTNQGPQLLSPRQPVLLTISKVAKYEEVAAHIET